MVQRSAGTDGTTIDLEETRKDHTFEEENVTSIVGSPGRQDELSRIVNLDSGKGASGFIGKMSEITWIQRAWEHISNPPQEAEYTVLPKVSHSLFATQDCNYFMDDH